MAGSQIPVVRDQPARNLVGLGATYSHDANTPAARWRGDGDDRVGGGKHPCPLSGFTDVQLLAASECALAAFYKQAFATSRTADYFRDEMRTVFENASPTLSVVTPEISATAMCTIRRSYGLRGPSCWSVPVCLAFSARNFAMCLSSMYFPLRYSSASTNTRLSAGSDRLYAMSMTCCR